MQEKRWENQYRATLVCVDDYEGCILKGRLINPGVHEPIPFYGAVQFFREMEKLLDDMRFPEAFSQIRVFQNKSLDQPKEETTSAEDMGRMASFNLRVLFRQNASWQGSVTWLEGKQDEAFRSALELLFLMDSALSCNKE